MTKALRALANGMIGAFKGADLQVARHLHTLLGGRVPHGPFAGMLAAETFSWGNATAKLLGIYESCLHPILASLPGEGIDAAMDIGCAEGYYAVGLARLLPGIPVRAHDTMLSAQQISRDLAERNGVGDRLAVGGLVSADDLDAWLRAWRRPFLMMDIEGAEIELLDLQRVPHLRRALILVELHDFRVPDETATMLGRFAATHDIERIVEQDPSATDYAEIAALPSALRSVALCELRPERMSWLWMRPRGHAS